MRRRYSPYSLPPWLRQTRLICCQIIIPITIFQGIRTIFFPSTFDVFLLGILTLLAVALKLEWL